MKNFIEFVNEEYDTRRTQRGNTGKVYEDTGKHLSNIIEPGSSILSLGAGLTHTSEALKRGLGSRHEKTEIHDMEPNPENRTTPPKYTSSDQIPSNRYHAVVCHNVVNVLPRKERDALMATAFDSVKPEGSIIIGSRPFKGDIANTKNVEPGPERGSVFVIGKNSRTYQKGFDGSELEEYAKSIADRFGHKVEVRRLPGIGKNSVHIKVLKKGKTNKK